MKLNSILPLSLLLSSIFSQAQTPPQTTKANPTVKATTVQVAKADASKSPKQAPRQRGQATEREPSGMPQAIDVSELTQDQLFIAAQVHTGTISCDQNISVTLTPDVPIKGRFLLELDGKNYIMTPVTTTTGAIRLENQWSGATWIQVANKSMLVNGLTSGRMADGCVHMAQQGAASLAQGQGLLD